MNNLETIQMLSEIKQELSKLKDKTLSTAIKAGSDNTLYAPYYIWKLLTGYSERIDEIEELVKEDIERLNKEA